MKTPLLIPVPFRFKFILSLCALLFTVSGAVQAQTVKDTLSGMGIYIVPVGITEITVETWGAGGGGGANGSGNRAGGGGGGYARSVIAVTPGQMISYEVGEGGTDGVDGGASTFDGGTVSAGGGMAGGETDGGDGGMMIAGTVGFNGGAGADAPVSEAGGGGGGSAFATMNGSPGVGSSGGAGQGPGGVGGPANNGSGGPGGLPGGGGGGKAGPGGLSTSGTGGDGRIIVTFTCDPPVFTTCPPSDTINVDPLECAAMVTYLVEFTPLSGEVSFEFTGATTLMGSGDGSGSVFAEGVTNVTLTLQTACDQETCMFTITVVDNEAPTITCPVDLSIGCADLRDPIGNPLVGLPILLDNCDDPLEILSSYTDSLVGGACPTDSFLTRYWVATDLAGNTSTCTQTISILDVIPPTVDFPADISILAGAMCVYDATPAVTGMPINIMDCDPAPMVSSNDVDGLSFCGLPIIVRTWTVADACGNTISADQTITVEDETPPVLIDCPTDVLVECDNIPDILSYIVSAVDNCSQMPIITSDEVITDDPDFPNYCPNYFMITRTWTAVDDCGNEASCIQVVRVRDTTDPVITCPADIIVECSDDLTPLSLGEATATDNCTADLDIAIINNDIIVAGLCTDEYTIQRTWTAEDECFNSTDCVQTITVMDTTIPEIDCPANAFIECDDDDSPIALGEATATDNCDLILSIMHSDMVTIGACPQTVTIERTWTATDNCSNSSSCIQLIEVTDSTPPVADCPDDETVECDAVPAPAMVPVTDNCTMDIDVQLVEDPSGLILCNNTGTLIRTWTFTDECSNESTCVQVITVEDNISPTWDQVMPVDVLVSCDAIPAAPGGLTYSDNCGAVMQVPVFDEQSTQGLDETLCDFYNYTITRTWDAVDECGNPLSHVQTITVQDITAPSFVLPSDIDGDLAFECGSEDDLSLTGHVSLIEDNCALDELDGASGYTPGDFSWVTANGYTVAFSDMVLDPHPSGACALSNNTLNNLKYLVNRTWTVTDPCGNTSTATQEIHITDQTPPVWSQGMPMDETVECDDVPVAPVGGIDLLATDNCDATLIYDFDQVLNAGACLGDYTLARTWTVEDQCGNSIVHTQTITVTDNEAPVLTGVLPGGNVGNVCFTDLPGAPTVATMEGVYSDACGTVTATLDDTVITGDDCSWTATYTYTISDDCGNEIEVDVVYTGGDNQAPTLIGVLPGGNTGNTCLADAPVAVAEATIEALYSDNCGTVTATLTGTVILGDDCSWTITYTYSVVDECNNASPLALVIYTGGDTGTPSFTVPALINGTVGLECGEEHDINNTGFPANITDNCAEDEPSGSDGYTQFATTWMTTNGYTISYSDVVIDPHPGGECSLTGNGNFRKYRVNRTWTVADPCGNTSTGFQEINVTDQTPPEWDQPMPVNITVECDMVPMAPVGGVDIFASDNCDAVVVYGYSEIPTPGSCPDAYSLLRTWTATDVCGNTNTHTQTIVVDDTTAPALIGILPGGNIGNVCVAGAPAAPVAQDIADLYLDNCGTVTATFLSTVLTGNNCSWTVTHTYTVEDECDNFAVNAEVIYQGGDNEAPVFVGALPGGDLGNVCLAGAPGAVPVEDIEDQYTDNCGDVTATLIDSDISGTDCAWTATFTYSIEDECGNAAANAVVVFFGGDDQGPLFTTPALIIGNDGLQCGEEHDLSITGFPTAITDNCAMDEPDGSDGYTLFATSWMTPNGYTISYSDNVIDPHPAGDCAPTGNGNLRKYRVERTWTVTDPCGNSTTGFQEINVTDQTPPLWDQAMPMDLTVECNMVPVAPVGGVDIFASDNCDAVVVYGYSEVPSAGSCPDDYSLLRTWTATDVCGNSTSHTQTIVVDDTTPPTLVGIIPGGMVGNVCVDVAPPAPDEQDIADLYSDNCGIVTATLISSDTTGTDCGWTVTYTYTVEDECTNFAANAAVIYQGADNEAPVLAGMLPGGDLGDVCLADAPGAVPVGDIEAVYTDNCGDVTATLIDSDIDGTDCAWTATFTYSIEDDCGNAAVNAVVIFNGGDDQGPVFTTPSNIPGDDGLECGEEHVLSITEFPTAITDNCAMDELDGSDGYTLFATTWMTTNGYTISFDDVVIDPHPNGECSLTGNGYFRKYRVERTWTVADPCGNTSTGLQLINVTDQTPPVWDQPMPVDVTVECDMVPVAPVAGVDIFASDNCDAMVIYGYSEVPSAGSCPDDYSLLRTWTATDVCGNSTSHTQTIVVDDTTPPSLVGIIPGGMVGNVCVDFAPPAPDDQDIADLYSDNCGIVTATLISSDTTGTDCGWTVTYTYTVEDECNNFAANAAVIYQGADNEAPNLVGALPGGDLGNVCLADAPGAVPVGDIEAQYTDNCGDVTATLIDSDITGTDCAWTATFTYSIEDDCGNAAVNAVVIFNGGDVQGPVFTTPALINGDAGLECGEEHILSTTGFPTAITDNCAMAELDGSDGYTLFATTWMTTNGYTISFGDVVIDPHPNGECSLTGNGYFRKYRVERTWTVTDPCGNTSTGLQQINITDQTPPAWDQAMPVDVTVECDMVPSAPVAGVDILATDNCDAMVTYDFAQDTIPGACDGAYELLRTWTATDVCGNSAVHTQSLQVIDTTDPTWDDTMPTDETVQCDAIPLAPVFTASDLCTDATVSFGESDNQGVDDTQCDFYNYTITRTWTATDNCGNSIVHTQEITVEDTINPTWDDPMPDEVTVACEAIPVVPVFTASDNCTADVTVTFDEVDDQDPDNTLCGFYTYTITRTWTAIDACGNAITHIQTINVEDITDPVLSACPVDVTISCLDPLPVPPVMTAMDNCDVSPEVSGPVDVSTQTNDGSCTDFSYTVTRTWTAMDACGNTDTCAQVVTVEDIVVPVISLTGPDTIEFCVGETYNDLGATAQDICFGDISASIVVNNPVNENAGGVYIVTYNVSDPCGNAAVEVSRTVVVHEYPVLQTSINGVTVTANNDGIDDIAPPQEICHAPNNVLIDFFTDLNAVPGSVLAYQTFSIVNVSVVFCDDCSAPLPAFTGVAGTASLIDPTMDGTLTMRFFAWLDINNNGLADPDECIGDWIEYTFTIKADIELTCPMDLVVPSCLDQADVDLAFNDWLATVMFTGGQNPMITDDNTGAPLACGGSTIVTWTVTSDCELDVTCSATFTVTPDADAPDFSGCTPADLDADIECSGLAANEAAAILWNTQNISLLESCVTDNCGAFRVESNYDFSNFVVDCGNAGELEVTYTVTDSCGNFNQIIGTFSISDTQAPDLSGCEPDDLDLTHECTGLVGNEAAAVAWNAANIALLISCVDDVCADFEVTNNYDFANLVADCGYTGALTVTYTITDSCGNAAQIEGTFTIEDNTDPTWDDTMPADETVSCDAIPAAPVFTADDICSPDVTVSFGESNDQDPDDTTCEFYTFAITRTWTAIDACGNAITHTQVINVEDTTEPVLSACPVNETIACFDPLPVPPVMTAMDNCDVSPEVSGPVDVSTQTNDGTCTDNSYTVTRTWTATDACGNTDTCAQVITIEDNIAPVITLVGPDTIDLCVGDAYTEFGATAADTCFGDITASIVVNNLVDENTGGVYMVTYNVSDPCGNAAIEVSRVVIVHEYPLLRTSINGVIVTANNDGIDDVAPPQEICHSPNNVVIDFFTDLNAVPGTVWAYQTTSTVNVSIAFCTACAAPLPAFTGATGTASLDDPTMDGTLTLRFFAWLDHNNDGVVDAGECVGDWIEYTFTIKADIELTCPMDLVVPSCQDQAAVDVAFNDWLATVMFTGGQNPMISDDNMGAPLACGGSTIVTWTVTSDCEADVTCSATFTVTPDAEAPDFAGCTPSDLDETVECSGVASNEAAAILWNMQNISLLESCVLDNCGAFRVESDYDFANLIGACGSTGTLMVTYTVTDSCNNSAMITGTLIIEDTTTPDLSGCNANDLLATHECDGAAGNELAADAWNAANILTLMSCAVDACGSISVTSDYDFSDLVGLCGEAGEITVTYTVTDDCGLLTTIEGVFTIEDTTAPDLNACDPTDLNASLECVGVMDNELAADAWNAANIATLEGCATDLCGAVIVSSDYDFANFSDDCGETGSITVTYTIMDECGNAATIEGSYTINDTTAPDLSSCVPADLNATHECDGLAGNELAADAWNAANIITLENCAEDACAGVSVSSDYSFANLSDACGETGVLAVTYTVTDECGNTTTIEGTFTIEDNIAPDLSACDPLDLDATHECDGAAGNELAADAWNAANIATLDGCAIEACAGITVTSDYDFADLSDLCGETGEITVTYTVTDECGNATTIEGTFTIEDNLVPDLTNCDTSSLDATFECIGTVGNESAGFQWNLANIALLEACAQDNCSDIEVQPLSVTIIFTCGEAFVVTQTYVVTDECNNSSTISGTFTIIDTTEPDLSACDPADLNATLECVGVMNNEIAADAWNAANIAILEGCAIDLCGDVVVTSDYDFANFSDDCGETGSITVTYTIMDECGNATTIEGSYTISDTTPPDLSGCVPADLNDTHECDGLAGNELAANAWNAANISTLEGCASDICSDVVITSDFAFANLNSACGLTGSILVTYTVTDECMNTSTITGTFTIIDTQDPVFDQVMPGDVTVECDDIPLAFAPVTATDACDGSIVVDFNEATIDGPCDDTYTLVRTWTATDACGNSTSHVQQVFVEDTTLPVFPKPADHTLYTDEDLATCPGVFSVSILANQGIPIATGNTPFTFEVHGVTIDGPTDYMDNCSSGDDLQLFAWDITQDWDGDASGCYRLIRILWRVYDNCGNFQPRQQFFTINDNTAPTFTAPADVTIFTDIDCLYDADPSATGDVTDEADNCTFSLNATYMDVMVPGSCEGELTIERTWSLTDSCGNAALTQLQVISVQDNIAPTFNAPADITIYMDANCVFDSTVANTGDVIDAMDNCTTSPSVGYSDDTVTGSCPDDRIITRTWTVADDCGNETVMTQIIIVSDTIAPTWDLPMPADETVECDNVPIPENYPASDNCDADVLVTYTPMNTQSGDISACEHYNYTLTRTWVAEDNCGNAITHTQVITVEDTTEPTFTKPDDVTILTSQGATCPTIADISLVIDQNNPIAVGGASFTYQVHGITFDGPELYGDNCADTAALEIRVHNVQVDFDNNATNCYRLIRVVWRVYDPCGNYTARQQYFTILDDSAPTFTVPADVTIFADAICDYDVSTNFTGTITDAADNCTPDPAISFTDGAPAAGSCEGEVIIQRTWEVMDDCGNTTTKTQTITVTDTISPTFTVPADITIFKDVDCIHDADISITGDVVDEADNCTNILDATFMDAMADGSCEGEMILTRTWSLVDSCGNITTQNQVITIQDTLNPIFPKPADITLSSEADNALCPGLFIMSVGADQFNPVASGNDFWTFEVHGVAIDGPTVYEDNCSSPSNLSLFIWSVNENFDGAADECYRLIQVIYRVYDDCGNFQQRQQFFTIIDNTAPTFTAPSDITIFTDDNCDYDVSIGITGDVTDEQDNCEIDLEATWADVILPGACEGEFVITRTWMLEDQCGNVAAPQMQTIIIRDITPPTFTTPADITIYKDAMCHHDADIIFTGDVSDEADNCTTVLDATWTDDVADGSCEGELLITRTWRLEDDCGNVTTQDQMILVQDTLNPFFPKPADMTLSTEDGATCPIVAEISLTIDQNNPVATNNEPFVFTVHGKEINGPTNYNDNCSSPANLSLYVWNIQEDFDGMAGDCYRLIRVIFRVYDDCGNFQQRQQLFTILEETPPVALCQDVTVYLDEFGDYILDPSVIDNGSSDNCDTALTLSVDISVFDCSDVGDHVVTLSVEDNCNHITTCTSMVTVLDTVPPNALCKDVTVFLDANGMASITVADIDDGSNDACGIASMVLSRTNFFCSDFGDVAITLTVTDVNGNVAVCDATVSVMDIIPPTAICKNANVVLNQQGIAIVHAFLIDDGSFDNCNIVSYEVIPPQFTCADVGQKSVTLIVTDLGGNTASCQSTVTVVDNAKPTMACKNITLYLNANGDPITIQPADVDNGSMDNCGFASLVISKSTFDCQDLGNNNVKLNGIDPSGNTGECTAVVLVLDTIHPVWSFLPGDVTVYCVENGAVEVPLATDNCDVVQVTLKSADQELWPAGPQNSYLVRRLWMAQDAAGNTIFYEQIVYVLPGGQLFVNCNGDIVTPETNIPIQVYWPIPFVDDICAGKEDMYQITGPPIGSYFNPGSETIITYEYIDFFGTRWQCAFWVTVPNDSNDYALILNEQECHNILLEDCDLVDLPSPDFYSFEYVVINQIPIRFNLVGFGDLEMYADGSARLLGQWSDGSGLCGWDMEIWFHRRRTHDGWIAAGGLVSNLVPGADPTTWDFFEVDASRSTMTGTGCYAGQNYLVSISPNFSKFGLQYGFGANTKTSANGGWVIIGVRDPNSDNLVAQGIFSFEMNCQYHGFTLKDAAEVVSLDGFDYPVEWSNGVMGPKLGDVQTGFYSVTITDQNGKDSIATFILQQPTDCELYYENTCRPGNVATSGQAKQISTFQGAVASRAIDGNTDGNAANNSVTGTLSGFQNWWSLDLIIPADVNQIRIWNRTDCCSDWLDPIWVFVSEDPIPEFGVPEDIAQLPYITAFFHDGPIDTFVEFDFQGKAQFVKIQLGQYGRLTLAEVQVLVCQPDVVGIQTEELFGDEEEEAFRNVTLEQIPEVTTWPNPANDMLDLEVRQEVPQPVSLSVMNLQGQEMYRIQLPEQLIHRLRVDVSGWAPGQYFLTTTSPVGARSQPITIQR